MVYGAKLESMLNILAHERLRVKRPKGKRHMMLLRAFPINNLALIMQFSL